MSDVSIIDIGSETSIHALIVQGWKPAALVS